MPSPTTADIRAAQDTQDRLESYLPCDIEAGVCLTRARLKGNVAEWARRPNGKDRAGYILAVRNLAAHHCEPPPTDATAPVPASNRVTIHDIDRVIQEYSELYRRAQNAPDLISERDLLRRQVLAMVVRFRAEGRMPDELPTICGSCLFAIRDGKRIATSTGLCVTCETELTKDLPTPHETRR